MAKLADYQILHTGSHRIVAGNGSRKGLMLAWDPPKGFVKSKGVARPIISYQIWTKTRTRFKLWFQTQSGRSKSKIHTRANLPPGQLITGSKVVRGPLLGFKGWIQLEAEFTDDDVASDFNVELVKIDYQVRT